MKPIHIAVAIPGEAMPIESVRCYGRLLQRLLTNPVPGLAQVSQSMFASSILPYARSRVIESALKNGATHILMLDSDMTYPGDLVHRLIAHGRPFVACNATTRRAPIHWVAKDKAGHRMDSSNSKGLEAASVVGAAVCLIERRVFEAIPLPKFDFEYTEKGWNGEDVYFSRRAIEAGFRPMIDHDASREIGHVGTYEFGGKDIAG